MEAAFWSQSDVFNCRHIKKQVQEEYLDLNTMDDSKLLMQYFRKHDTDKNHKLDGLELLKAIANMEEDHSHDYRMKMDHADPVALRWILLQDDFSSQKSSHNHMGSRSHSNMV